MDTKLSLEKFFRSKFRQFDETIDNNTLSILTQNVSLSNERVLNSLNTVLTKSHLFYVGVK